MSILENITKGGTLNKLSVPELECLAAEIRMFLVDSISKTGGHLASNLGVVELTLAIHRVYDLRYDRLVFDVGHQSYIHKILTGRISQFSLLRKYGGLSGFPKPSESCTDAFIAGHASNSISVALGMARARTLQKENYKVVCLIGDGALTGGLAYEAMNNAGNSREPLVVILNDNGMSITKNVGAVSKLLAMQRTKPAYYSFKKGYRKLMNKLPGGRRIYRVTHNIKTIIKQALLHCSMFEEMGFRYFGPVDGHNLVKTEYFLRQAMESAEPALVHVVTKKGKGYAPAEDKPDAYHGVEPFNSGQGISSTVNRTFSAVFGRCISDFASADRRICTITAAMPAGTGLLDFAQKFPDRFFDVGIAEGHAVTMAAGMAKQGMRPIVAVYSSFLQRAYDMLIHDVAILKLPVILAIDRAGLVGEDGETHHGVFDTAFLSQIPGMTLFAPASFAEMNSVFKTALQMNAPVAVRYPRGAEGLYTQDNSAANTLLAQGDDITLIGYGMMINNIIEANRKLIELGIGADVIKLTQLAPLDMSLILESVRKTKRLMVIEDAISSGSVGEHITSMLPGAAEVRYVLLRNLGMRFIAHGNLFDLQMQLRLDAQSITEDAAALVRSPIG